MQKLVTFLIVVLIAALAALITMPQWGVKKPDKVLIGHIPDVPNCWLYYGLEQEIFEKYKIDVQVVEFIDYEEALDSLEEGNLDYLFSVPWSLLLAEVSEDYAEVTDTVEMTADTLEAGGAVEAEEDTLEMETTLAEELQVFLSFQSTVDEPYGAIVVAEMSKLEKIEDLRRKTVGYLTHPFAEHEVLLRRALEQKINKRYVKVEPVDKLEIPTLIKENTIAGGLVYEPDLAKLIDQGDKKILEEDPIATHVITPYPTHAACMSTSFLEEKPLVALNFRTALEEALALGTEDDENLRNALAELGNLSPSHSLKVRLPVFRKYEEIDVQTIQAFADLLAGEEILVDTVDVEGILFEASE